MGFPLLITGGAQAGQIHGQNHAVQRALGTAALEPADKVVPQPVLDFAGGAFALVLAQQFAVRIDQYTVIANPPVKTKGIAVAPVISGNVGEGIGLPCPLNQAGLAGIFQAHHQVPGQAVQAFAAGQIAFQGLQLAVQQALLPAFHGQDRIFLFLLLLGLGFIHLAQPASQGHTPEHHHQQDHAKRHQSPHLPGHQRVISANFQPGA